MKFIICYIFVVHLLNISKQIRLRNNLPSLPLLQTGYQKFDQNFNTIFLKELSFSLSSNVDFISGFFITDFFLNYNKEEIISADDEPVCDDSYIKKVNQMKIYSLVVHGPECSEFLSKISNALCDDNKKFYMTLDANKRTIRISDYTCATFFDKCKIKVPSAGENSYNKRVNNIQECEKQIRQLIPILDEKINNFVVEDNSPTDQSSGLHLNLYDDKCYFKNMNKTKIAQAIANFNINSTSFNTFLLERTEIYYDDLMQNFESSEIFYDEYKLRKKEFLEKVLSLIFPNNKTFSIPSLLLKNKFKKSISFFLDYSTLKKDVIQKTNALYNNKEMFFQMFTSLLSFHTEASQMTSFFYNFFFASDDMQDFELAAVSFIYKEDFNHPWNKLLNKGEMQNNFKGYIKRNYPYLNDKFIDYLMESCSDQAKIIFDAIKIKKENAAKYQDYVKCLKGIKKEGINTQKEAVKKAEEAVKKAKEEAKKAKEEAKKAKKEAKKAKEEAKKAEEEEKKAEEKAKEEAKINQLLESKKMKEIRKNQTKMKIALKKVKNSTDKIGNVTKNITSPQINETKEEEEEVKNKIITPIITPNCTLNVNPNKTEEAFSIMKKTLENKTILNNIHVPPPTPPINLDTTYNIQKLLNPTIKIKLKKNHSHHKILNILKCSPKIPKPIPNITVNITDDDDDGDDDYFLNLNKALVKSLAKNIKQNPMLGGLFTTLVPPGTNVTAFLTNMLPKDLYFSIQNDTPSRKAYSLYSLDPPSKNTTKKGHSFKKLNKTYQQNIKQIAGILAKQIYQEMIYLSKAKEENYVRYYQKLIEDLQGYNETFYREFYLKDKFKNKTELMTKLTMLSIFNNVVANGIKRINKDFVFAKKIFDFIDNLVGKEVNVIKKYLDIIMVNTLKNLNETKMNETNLNHTNLNQTNLNQTNLNQTNLNQTHLNGTKLNQTHLNHSTLNGTNLNQTTLKGTNLNQTTLNGTNLNQTTLNQSNLNQTHLNGTKLNQTHFNQTNLNETHLNETILNQTNLNQTNLNQTNLNHTNLNHSTLNQTHFNHTNLNHTNLNQTHLNQTHLNQKTLNQTHLNQTHLNKKTLNHTTLKHRNLNQTTLNETNLNQTNLNETHLNETHLNDTDLNETNLNQKTLNETYFNLKNFNETNFNLTNFNETTNLQNIKFHIQSLQNSTNYDKDFKIELLSRQIEILNKILLSINNVTDFNITYAILKQINETDAEISNLIENLDDSIIFNMVNGDIYERYQLIENQIKEIHSTVEQIRMNIRNAKKVRKLEVASFRYDKLAMSLIYYVICFELALIYFAIFNRMIISSKVYMFNMNFNENSSYNRSLIFSTIFIISFILLIVGKFMFNANLMFCLLYAITGELIAGGIIFHNGASKAFATPSFILLGGLTGYHLGRGYIGLENKIMVMCVTIVVCYLIGVYVSERQFLPFERFEQKVDMRSGRQRIDEEVIV